jgi:deazaflavin-dependent oxidoreductase (nitroreductase family)
MSVPAAAPGRSLGHRIVSLVVRSPLGLGRGRNIASRVDPTSIRLTRGHVSSVWTLPVVVVTHVGAKSGRTRSSALLYFTDRGLVILLASSFDESRNPAWYHEGEANPFVTLYGRGIRGRFIAEEIYDAERDCVFERAKDAVDPYGQYEQAAAPQSRCVPVIAFTSQSCRCDPAVVDPHEQRLVRFRRRDRRARSWLRAVSTKSGSRPCQPHRHCGRHRRTRCKANTDGQMTPRAR